MKYLLIAILTLSATAHAKPFTMADWQKTLPTPQKVEVKQTRTLSESIEGVESAIAKFESRKIKLHARLSEISQQFAQQRVRLSKLDGNASKGIESATRDYNTRTFGVKNEIAKIDIKIKGYREAIAYYSALERNRMELAKIEKKGLILKARGFIS
jgi:chromosome segregation ATPase